MKKFTKYMFSFGSNLNLQQMERRCPNATPITPAVLEDYKLEFWGNYRGYGVATILPSVGSKVVGAIWEVTAECIQELNIYEGYPRLYDIENMIIRGENGIEYECFTYIMVRGRITSPSSNYLYTIMQGYEDFGLDKKTLYQAYKRAEF